MIANYATSRNFAEEAVFRLQTIKDRLAQLISKTSTRCRDKKRIAFHRLLRLVRTSTSAPAVGAPPTSKAFAGSNPVTPYHATNLHYRTKSTNFGPKDQEEEHDLTRILTHKRLVLEEKGKSIEALQTQLKSIQLRQANSAGKNGPASPTFSAGASNVRRMDRRGDNEETTKRALVESGVMIVG